MTFCLAPYLGMTIDPKGWINLCCNVTDREHFGVTISQIDDLTDFFVSSQYKKVRDQVKNVGIENIDGDICRVCRLAREGGYRAEIDTYDLKTRRKYFEPVPTKIRYLEVTTSNTCNQTCVMCSSYFSTKWKSLESSFHNMDLDLDRGEGTDTFMMSEDDINKIMKILPDLKMLQIKGGEPFADKRNLRIARELAKVNPDCELTITSNFQKVSDEWFEVLSQLNNVCAGASIDGIGQTFNWIRGGDFDEVENNLLRFKNEVKPKALNVNSCISVYNIFQMKEMWERYKGFNYNNYNVVTDPVYLKPGLFKKEQLWGIIHDQFGTLDHPAISPNLKNCSIILEEEGEEKYKFRKKQFSWWTSRMNEVRGFDIFDLHPQLCDIFK